MSSVDKVIGWEAFCAAGIFIIAMVKSKLYKKKHDFDVTLWKRKYDYKPSLMLSFSVSDLDGTFKFYISMVYIKDPKHTGISDLKQI